MERRGGGERLPEMDTFQRGIKKKIILPRRLARSGYVVSIGPSQIAVKTPYKKVPGPHH